jgi:hypothetical protein
VAAGDAGTTNLGSSTGLNLNNALNALLTAQNALIQYWASYERNRINIYRDMDIMQIDERGLWIDPVYQNLGGRGNSFSDEPAHDNLPEPSASRSRSNPEPERSAGVVRLVGGTPPRSEKVTVGTTNRPGRFGSWFNRGRDRGVARDSSSVDAGEE